MTRVPTRPWPYAVFFVALGCAPSTGLAQDIDSLRHVWEAAEGPDSARFAACHALAWDGYLFSSPDTAARLATALRAEARSKRYPKFVAISWDLDAAVRYVKGDFPGAIRAYDSSLAIYREQRDSSGMADVLTNMAGMLSFMDKKDTALVLYDEGLRMHLAMRDSVSIANDLNAIGRVHMVRGDHARATEFYARSLRIQETLKNDRGISTTLMNLGAVHLEQADFASALGYYRRALDMAIALNDQHLIGKDLEEVGSCLEELGDTAAALEHFQRSLSVREELGDMHGLVNVRNRIAGLEFSSGDPDRALDLYRTNVIAATAAELPWGLGNALVGEADVLLALNRPMEALTSVHRAEVAASDAEDLVLQRDVVEVKYRVLRQLGKWKEALEAHARMGILNDSLMREENQREILRHEYRYAYEQQAVTDSLRHALEREAEALRAEQRLGSERTRRNLVLAALVLALVIGASLWQRSRILKRTNRAIIEAQQKLVESERAREASEVRTRIARDVHDQLGSDLTKLALLSSESRAMLREDPNAFSGLTDEMERIAVDANRSLGDIVWAIDTEHDSLAGLTDRIRSHCERMLTNSGIRSTIDCVHVGQDRTLDPGTRRDVHMILREALNNALKHAQAQHIQVRFHSSATALEMEVIDDGIGPTSRSEHAGNGLRNMRQRAERCGATLRITDRNGTTVSLKLDLQNERPA